MSGTRLVVNDPIFIGLETFHTEKDNIEVLCSIWKVGQKERLVFIITTSRDGNPYSICCFYDPSKPPAQGDFVVHGETSQREYRLNLNDFFNIPKEYNLKPR